MWIIIKWKLRARKVQLQIYKHITFPFSSGWVNMTMTGVLLSQIICQKSATVSGVGPYKRNAKNINLHIKCKDHL